MTVIVGSRGPEASLVRCLVALEGQRRHAEVVVAEAERSSGSVRAQFPWAHFLEHRGALMPELWAEGIAYARGRIVALTIAPMTPAPDWVEAMIEAHAEADAVGGAIEPGSDLRPADWAEYFCRYTPHMIPFESNEQDDLAGDNASYKRSLLLEEGDLLREGFWEPVVHPVLRRRGAGFRHTPSVLVRMERSGGFVAFARQRSEHGRLYAHQRGHGFSRARHALGVLGSLAVPFLMTFRVVRRVFARRRLRTRLTLSLPRLFALNVVWAFAEARGHLECLTGTEDPLPGGRGPGHTGDSGAGTER